MQIREVRPGMRVVVQNTEPSLGTVLDADDARAVAKREEIMRHSAAPLKSDVPVAWEDEDGYVTYVSAAVLRRADSTPH
jgi:hypothetical protein